MKKHALSKNMKKNISKVTASLLLFSTIATALPLSVKAASKTVNLDVDAAVVTGQRFRTESYNNFIGLPWDKAIAGEYKNVMQTEIARDFFALQGWYSDQTKTITDPANSDPGKNLYTAMKDSNNQKSTMTNSILMSVMTKGVSSTGILFKKDANGAVTKEFDYDEFEKVLKVGLLQMKKNSPKLEYIEAENEPDLDSCHPGASKDVNTYLLHYARFSNAVRWVNTQLSPEDGPPLKLVGPILATFNAKFLTDFMDGVKAGGYQFDVLSWHHYNENSSNIEINNRFIRTALDERGFNSVNVFLSEYGYVGGQEDYAPSNAKLALQAAFMTDSALMAERVPGVVPFNWVTAHSTAMFKNQYLWDPAVGSGSGQLQDFPVTNINNSGRYVRFWLPPGPSPSGTATTVGANVKEIEFYDENGQKITLPAQTGSAANITDGNLTTGWTATGQGALEIDLGSTRTISKVRVATSTDTWTSGSTKVTPTNKFVVKVTNDRINYTDIVGVAKKTPYYHTMEMRSMLGNDLIKSTGLSTDMLGVRMEATKNSDSKLSMMVWNYQSSNTQAYDINLNVKNLPTGFVGKNVKYTVYLVDSTHSNLRNLPSGSTAYTGSDAMEIYQQGILPAGDLANLNLKLNPNAVAYIELTPDSGQVVDTLVSGGKAVTASSGANTGYMNDGDFLTSWSAADNSYPQSWVMDLGAQFNLNRIETKWTNSESRGYKYKIETSSDGTDFSQAVDNTNNLKYGDTYDSLTANARYVRVTVTGCLTSETTIPAASVDEFRVYSASNAALPVLTDMKLNGSTVTGFNPLQKNYTVSLPAEVENARIEAAVPDGFTVTPALVNLPLAADGTAQRQIFAVTANDGSSSQYYSVSVRRMSSNVTIGSMVLSIGKEPSFETGKSSYDVSLPAGTKDVKVLSVSAKDQSMGAAAAITQQADILNGVMAAKILVTAENGAQQETVINFTVADEPVRGRVKSSDDFELGNFGDWKFYTSTATPTVLDPSTQFSFVQQTGDKVLTRAGGSANYLLYKDNSDGSDYVVEGKVQPNYYNVLPGITARVSSDAKTYYYLRFRGTENSINLEKSINGSLQTAIAKYPIVQQVNKWYTLKMVLKGSSIKCFLDGQLIIDAVDTSIASGKAGYRLSNGASSVDDFIVSELPPSITSIAVPETVEIVEGLTPVLPANVTASYEDGTTHQVPVTWGAVDTSTTGDKTVTGTVTDYIGAVTNVTMTVHVNEREITAVTAPAAVEVLEGLAPVLPSAVTVSYNNNTTGEAAVTWETVDTSIPGEKTVTGTVTGFSGSVSIKVIVNPKQIVSLAAPAPVEVVEGLTPALPATVTASYDNNTTGEVAVTWGTVDTSTVGDKIVTGTVAGYTGTVSMTVHVKAAVITSIKKVADITVYHKDTVTLPATVTAVYNNGTEKAVPVKWEVTNVDTREMGEQTIKGTVDGYNGEVSVVINVVRVEVKSVNLNTSNQEVSVGAVLKLAAAVTPENATYKNVVWSSSDESVAKVDNNGVVTILKAGTVEITAKAEADEAEAKCTITAKSAVQYDPEKLTEALMDQNLKAVVLDVTTTPVIDSSLLNSITGEDKTVTFVNRNSEGVVESSWTFNGTTINKEVQNLDLGVKFTSPKQEDIKKVSKAEEPLVVSFDYHGELPGTAKVKIKINSQWLVGKNADDLYLYYFNPEKNTLEPIAQHLKVDSEGYVEFEITHCSDYVLLDKEVRAEVQMPKTGSIVDFRVLETTGILTLVCGLFILFGRKRRQN